MNEDEERIADLIQEAFQGVQLGDGLGLTEADGLDDYANSETLARYRDNDEKFDWSKITVDQMNRYSSSLAFFDPEGMRFHLPAYLIADLEGTLAYDLEFHITYVAQDAMSRFSLLSGEQRRAVRQFLLLKLSKLEQFSDHPGTRMIEQALATFWLENE